MERSQRLLLAHRKEMPQLAREALENQARLYNLLGKHDQSLQVYETILDGLSNNRTDGRYRSRILQKIAQVYGRNLENHRQEAIYWQRALDLTDSKMVQSTDLELARIYRELIRCYLNQGKLSAAAESLEKAKQYQSTSGNKLEEAIIAFSEARLLNAYGRPLEALEVLDRGRSAFSFPPSASLGNIQVLRSVLLFEIFKQTKEPVYLQQAETWSRQSLRTLEDFENRTYQQRSYGKNYRKPTEMLLQCLFERQRREPQDSLSAAIFSAMEKSRASSLRLGSRWEDTYLRNRYPEALVQQYLDQRQARLAMLNRRYSLERRGEGSEILANLADSLIRLEQDYAATRRQLNEIAPLPEPEFTLAAAQQRLQDAEIMLFHFAGDSTLFTMGISNDHTVFHSQSLSTTIKTAISTFTENVRRPDSSPEQLAALAWELHESILAPVLTQFPAAPQQLLIVPDGITARIPWPALCTALPRGDDFREWPFLIRKYRINLLSAAAELKDRYSTAKTVKEVSCFAPAYPPNPNYKNATDLAHLTRQGFWALPGAHREVEGIAGVYGGPATIWDRGLHKPALKDAIRETDILHLAMHAMPDFQDPSQSFLLLPPRQDATDDRLTALEINELDLDTDLFVLSACYSGDGPWQPGEAVMSLAYALRAAGVRSVVSNAWAVADQVTGDLMIDFHRMIGQGVATNEALQQAQLAHLRNARPIRSAHPFYWAGFQLQGPASRFAFRRTASYWWYFGGLAAFLLVAFYRRSRSKVAA